VTGQLCPSDINQESLNVCVAGTIPEKRQKTPFRGAKEARSNEAIGSQPQAAACATERAAHWSDETNSTACAVSKSVSARRAMRIIGSGRKQRKLLLDRGTRLRCWHHERSIPGVRRVEWHVFNEAHFNAKSSGKFGQIDCLVIIHSANQHGIQFERCESFGDTRVNTSQHIVRRCR
jgi:hypothetical protein